MADLQVCYFCGNGPDSSLGEYAVVPPGLDPTDEQQRSVVLCPDCRGKLTTVMEPVVQAAQAAASDGPGATDHDERGTADADTSPAGDTEPGDPTAVDEANEPGTADDPLADTDADDGRPAETDQDAPDGTDDEVEVPPPDRGAEVSDEVSFDPGGGSGSDESAPDDQPGTPSAGSTPGGEDADPPSPDRTPPHADDELVGRNNEAYNNTLRLLQNREFPVERHEIEQVAANAYQLDPQEVSDAIDSLIRKGLLVQEGAHLQRP